MAIALRERILARAALALAGATPAGPRVYRSRTDAIPKDLASAIVVLFDGEVTKRQGNSTSQHDMTLLLSLLVRGDPWDQLANELDEAAHRALLADAQLVAMTSDIERLSADPEAEEADRTAGALSVRFRVRYLTSVADLSAAPL